MAIRDIEGLGLFYLGAPYDLESKTYTQSPFLYHSKDLVTHALIIGMTGSGKTGLSVAMLEEAALDAIPAIIIDPKGDMGNLLLTFPELRPDQFRPWISETAAEQAGMRPLDFAAVQSKRWREELGKWGQDGARIQRLQSAVERTIYTPGSNAGIPVSLLASLAVPAPAVLADEEAFRDCVETTGSSILSLIGVGAERLTDREHILVALILAHVWRKEQAIDLSTLVALIQSPPFTQVGLADVETFYPATERFVLAMRLNNLLASPGFSTWMQGEALDIDQMLYTRDGRPRHAIFALSHLSEQERIFFVSFLLNQLLSWSRAQRGTPSLRAILYMDEVFGYLPPIANPPSKRPLITLLKQARASGLGILLASQNPVDLDYKALANMGTWFVGRLQTERDKARLLDGLQGTGGQGFDRKRIEALLSQLGSRIFLVNNVHRAPQLLMSRSALSFLAGPLDRHQIKSLMEPVKAARAPEQIHPVMAPHHRDLPTMESIVSVPIRPAIPPEITQFVAPVRSQIDPGESVLYIPMVYGLAQVQVIQRKRGIEVSANISRAAPIGHGSNLVDWAAAITLEMPPEELQAEMHLGARFLLPPPNALGKRSAAVWRAAFHDALYRTFEIELLNSPQLDLIARPGESERQFRLRVQELAKERRDMETEQLHRKYAPKVAALEERLRKARQRQSKESQEAKSETVQSVLSIGFSFLQALVGGRRTATISRASTAARSIGRSVRQRGDVHTAAENVELLVNQLAELEATLQEEVEAIAARLEQVVDQIEVAMFRPRKADIVPQLIGLIWVPYRVGESGEKIAAWE